MEADDGRRWKETLVLRIYDEFHLWNQRACHVKMCSSTCPAFHTAQVGLALAIVLSLLLLLITALYLATG
jgi:hypothetical protein